MTTGPQQLKLAVERLQASLARNSGLANSEPGEDLRRVLSALSAAEAERDTLRGVVEEQRLALAPFQKVAEHDIGDDEADHDLFRPMSPRYARAPVLTVGDFRRALSLSAGVGSPSETKPDEVA